MSGLQLSETMILPITPDYPPPFGNIPRADFPKASTVPETHHAAPEAAGESGIKEFKVLSGWPIEPAGKSQNARSSIFGCFRLKTEIRMVLHLNRVRPKLRYG
jgi:hypothetical protein